MWKRDCEKRGHGRKNIPKTEKWKHLVWKLLTRSTRLTRFCTAQHSKIQPIFVKLCRIFKVLLSIFHWFFSKRCLKSTNFHENSSESQQFFWRRQKSVRFLNFLRFRSGNRRIFRKWFFEKLKNVRKSSKNLELEENPF